MVKALHHSARYVRKRIDDGRKVHFGTKSEVVFIPLLIHSVDEEIEYNLLKASPCRRHEPSPGNAYCPLGL
jgi:hypothetical protein